ncbi:MAG: hypothetical protein Q8M24_00945 [Pseudolabrys sp.]|nr:hypothetical protein [Pseudolabrys sp.]MDP2294014.1 hypothetical protein [Pseudolabrys sp.]
MPRADFLTGLVLLVVSAMLIGEGLTLPGAGGLIMKGGEPGRVPLFLGFVIATMAVVLIVRAISQNGHRLRQIAAFDTENKRALGRALAVAVGGTLYVGLLGHNFSGADLDYALLTFGFILTFIVIAEWKLAPEIAGRRWQALDRRAPAMASRIAAILSFVSPARAPYVWLFITATFQAAALAVLVSYVFEKQFFVQLP